MKSSNTRKRKNTEPLPPQDALSMLESAVSYCQASGIAVGAANGSDGTLGLFIPNAHYVLTDGGARAAFLLGTREAYPVRDGALLAHSDEIKSTGTLAQDKQTAIAGTSAGASNR